MGKGKLAWRCTGEDGRQPKYEPNENESFHAY
jgi:hypothetical protein